MLRKYADDAEKQQIDGYLIDWYGAPSYEGRANDGATLGAAVVRMIGAPGVQEADSRSPTASSRRPARTRRRTGSATSCCSALAAYRQPGVRQVRPRHRQDGSRRRVARRRVR